VPPGALIVIDELGMHWPKGRSTREFPQHLEKFLRMHRHMADAATKQTTDLALSTQHYVDVHTVVRPLCEKTFKFKKLATLGLSKRYVWSMWEGGSAPKGEAVLNGDGKYNPDIFALYKSHSLSDGSGLEAAVDKRATMFGPKFMVGAAVAVVLVLVGAGFMVKLFTPDQVKPKAPGQTGDQVAATGGGVVPAAGAPEPHPDLRIAGMVRTATVNAVVLADKSGRLRLESPSLCFIDRDRPVSCNIDGRSVLPSAATGAVGARPGGNVIFGGAL
jgi:zona occludens toxin